MTEPTRHYENARTTADGRWQADLNGCKLHTNVCDYVRWPGGDLECALCARGRQEAYMTPEQRKNVAFHMPHMKDWKR